MDYRDRHVIVTGGTGALGTATVAALIDAGAVCHVPYIDQAEADRFPLRNHANVDFVADVDLSQESSVAKLYATVPKLWASIHIAGGFAMAPIATTAKSDLMKQVDMNFVTAFLCCRAAVIAMTATGAGGRILNVATRPALEWRAGAGMTAYTATKAAVAALTGALADRTRIVIAHRASTAARTDAVIWLDDGRIRAFAAHEQLWHDPGYRALFEVRDEAVVAATTNGGPP